MPPRRRRVILLAILFFVIHLIATVSTASRLSTTLDLGGPVAGRFAPSFAVVLSTFPLYPFLRGTMPFHTLTLLNDGLCAIVAAFALVCLRWRTVLALLLAMTILVFGGALVAAMWMEHRTQALWRALAPHAIGSARGTAPVESSLGGLPIEPLSVWLAKEIARGDDRVDALPQEVEHFLIVHQWEIEALRERLLRGAPPEPTEDPAPYFHMSKILLADALQTRSWRDVDAAQRLTEAMLLEPSHRSVLYAITAAENQLAVARKLDPRDAVPLSTFDPHAALIDALVAEAARIQKISGPWYARPYTRLCIAESAYSALHDAKRIRDLRGCRFDGPAETEAEPWVPFNPTGVSAGGPSYATMANRLLLDREGTASVLAVKRGGRPVSSALCRDRTWLFAGNILELKPPLPARHPALPTHHEILPRPATRSTSE